MRIDYECGRLPGLNGMPREWRTIQELRSEYEVVKNGLAKYKTEARQFGNAGSSADEDSLESKCKEIAELHNRLYKRIADAYLAALKRRVGE